MRKRARTPSVDSAIVDVWKREVGAMSTRNFAHRLAAAEDLVLRLDIFRKLERHRGCVNTVSFNADGDILVTGSDDRNVILWDWETGNIKLSFHSGHHDNVFQAKIMPNSEDRSIVTCAADGQVRHAKILEGGKVNTKLLAKHHGRAHKLAIEPGSPHVFYTCGEDGLVHVIDLRTEAATELFTCQPLRERSHMSVFHLNAIAMDPRNPNLFSVAGSDEFARLYDIRKCKWDGTTDFGQPVDFFCPQHLIGDAHVGITGLAFSDQSELLVSYNDESIYLFARDMGLGADPPTSVAFNSSSAGETGSDDNTSLSDMDSDAKIGPQVYKGHRNCKTVKGVNFFGPKSEYVVSGSDCGRIFIWRKKGGELVRLMDADKHIVNCIEPHPHITVLASSGIENDIKIWTPKALERAILPTIIEKVRNPDRLRFFWFGDIDDDDEEQDFFYTDDDTDDDDDDNDNSSDDDDEDEELDEDDFFDYNDEEDSGDSEDSVDDGDEASGGELFYESVDNEDFDIPFDDIGGENDNSDLGDGDGDGDGDNDFDDCDGQY